MSDPSGRARLCDWLKLPPELVQLISGRVHEIDDYVRFGAVFKPWLSAACSLANLPRQIPWMLLPYDPDDSLRRFYSPSNRTYKFDLCSSRGHYVCTSPKGWLLMTDASFSFSLLNPITREHIHLPPLSTSATLVTVRQQIISQRHALHDLKTQLLMTPLIIRSYPFTFESGDSIIALVTGDSFLYFREQDRAWKNPHKRLGYLIESLTYHGGRFYIIYNDWEVATCELSSEANPILIPSLRVPVDLGCRYLVSAAGELLLVSTYIDYFQMDQQQTWSKIQNIGDHILFLIFTNIVVVVAGESSRCRCYVCSVLGITSPAQQSYGIGAMVDNVEKSPHLADWVQSIWFTPSMR